MPITILFWLNLIFTFTVSHVIIKRLFWFHNFTTLNTFLLYKFCLSGVEVWGVTVFHVSFKILFIKKFPSTITFKIKLYHIFLYISVNIERKWLLYIWNFKNKIFEFLLILFFRNLVILKWFSILMSFARISQLIIIIIERLHVYNKLLLKLQNFLNFPSLELI